eukprot:gene13971-20862_t
MPLPRTPSTQRSPLKEYNAGARVHTIKLEDIRATPHSG